MDTLPEVNPQVADVLATYPKAMRDKILFLRELIFSVVAEDTSIDQIEETLKWSEPAYVTSGGSTVRLAWKQSAPRQYAIYFHCKTKLLDTFREIYPDKFIYDGNRAIYFDELDVVPVKELKHCIMLSLTYHSRKQLPLLGA